MRSGRPSCWSPATRRWSRSKNPSSPSWSIGERVHEIYERLLATLVEDRGLELISDIVAEVTGKAVYLLDEHFQPTLQTGGDNRTAEALADVRRRYWEGLLGNVSERLIVLRPVDQEPTAAALRPLTLRGAV